jgi:hypothetical protein
MEPVRPLVDAYLFDWMNRGPAAERMVFRASQWELSPNGFVCGAAFGDGRGMAQSSFTLRETSGEDFLARQIEEV